MKHVLSRSYIRIAQSLYRHLDTPRSLTCFLLVKHKEWDQLAAMATDPNHYLDVPNGIRKYFYDAQATDFLRKCEDLPCTFDRKEAAQKSFDDCELACAETNYFLELLILRGDRNDTFGRALLAKMAIARKIIRRILGPVPASLSGRFGPGTAFELQGSAFSTLADKLFITPHVTRAAEAVWRHTYDDTIMDRQRLENGLPYKSYCQGNRFTTVPKTAKTDRGICIEPLGNLYCQLGVGGYLKERLASAGLNVQRNNAPLCPLKMLYFIARPTGQTVHRKLAEIASVDGSWATIDLSNASDTVAYQLVKALLPTHWFQLLSSLRSPKTRLLRRVGRRQTKVWSVQEKFSSMGNGFTFELETLIFAALAAAVSDLDPGVNLFVYGDDIIVPTSASNDVLAILRAVGFQPNVSKTFTTGLFRESCGGDYFGGFDVRPVFSKAEPSSPLEWVALHNNLKKKFPRFSLLYKQIVEQVPVRHRIFGPSWTGDTTFNTDIQASWSRPKLKARRRAPPGYTPPDRVKLTEPPALDDGITWLRCLCGSDRLNKIPLDRWGSEFIVSLALLGVDSTGIVPRGAVPDCELSFVSVS